MNRKMYFWNLAGNSQICVEYLKLLLKNLHLNCFRRFEVELSWRCIFPCVSSEST
jgi:hypothetical protein